MKIKQQKDIRKFLESEFSASEGEELFARQEKILLAMVRELQEKDKSRYKTLAQTIYPRIALYKALQEALPENEKYQVMRKYMLDVVAAAKHKATARMEIVPGFFYIYRAVFLRIMRTTTLQESTQSKGKGFYDITLTRCLWHDACVKYRCPELCTLFCDVDDVTYGNLRKIGFTRTKTLGYGGDCCDFHFYSKA